MLVYTSVIPPQPLVERQRGAGEGVHLLPCIWHLALMHALIILLIGGVLRNCVCALAWSVVPKKCEAQLDRPLFFSTRVRCVPIR